MEPLAIPRPIPGSQPAVRTSFLVFLALSLALLPLLATVPKDSFQPEVLQGLRRFPVPQALQIRDPIFKKGCYNYENVTATNVCCKMKRYDFPDVAKCVQAFNATRK